MKPITLAVLLSASLGAAIIPDARALINKQDFAAAEKLIEAERKNGPWTPELLEAQSWLGRGALASKQYDKALAYAAQTRKLCMEIMKTRPLDSEKRLPIAFGATIEVTGQALAGKGQLSEGVGFLKSELKAYRGTSMRARIQKNIHLLSLEGKPAPAIELTDSIGSTQPVSMSEMKGHPVLIFFWAHWCGDCKAEAPIIEELAKKYAAKGLKIVGPTQFYGYTAGGNDATPAEEKAYIAATRDKYYAAIPSMSVPLSTENFKNYGSSTTPTLVLVDKSGIVRMYNPGALTLEQLQAKIEPLL